MTVRLPDGVLVGHVSDHQGWTGCTVILCPDDSVAACEVRGGGPGTRETDLLSPAANAPGVNAILLAGGSAFGLAAADGVVQYLEEKKVGYPTRAGVVPLVAAAVVYDLALGSSSARPRSDDGYAAASAASANPVARGSVGAGKGCTVGKLLGSACWTKGGFGVAARTLGDGSVAALAAVNAFGDVLAEDASVLAGVWKDGGYCRSVELLAGGVSPARLWRQSTTLVCVVTDARLTKRDAWLVARSASGGVARAVDPVGTSVDGDVAFCVATGREALDPLAVAALAADVTAAAIRDAVRSATGGPGCQSLSDRL